MDNFYFFFSNFNFFFLYHHFNHRTFELNDEQLRDVREGKCQVHFRLFNKLDKADVEWSLDFHKLQVNHAFPTIIRKKTRTAPVKNPFVIRQPPAFDRTIFKKINYYNFSSANVNGYLVIQLSYPINEATVSLYNRKIVNFYLFSFLDNRKYKIGL